jgi:GAF domain-containing protein
MVRQSCGCSSPVVMQAATGPAERELDDLNERRVRVLEGISRAVEGVGLSLNQAEQLFDSFVADVQGEAPSSFLPELSDALHRAVTASGDVSTWQGLVSTLRRHLRPRFDDVEALSRAEDLWQQARVMIAETIEQARVSQAIQVQQQTETLHKLGGALVATFDVPDLMDILAQGLPRLGISGCYLSLYEDPACPTEWSWLHLAYDETGRVELEAGGRRFPSPQLVPEGLLPRNRPRNLVLEPLYFQDTHLGFVLFEAGLREGDVYETLRAQISSALQGASLIEQLEGRMRLIQTASEVSRVASGILDPRELIQQAVDLIRERFDLYYVGLFLVQDVATLESPPGEWAYLQAGTGEAGREMKRKKHRLKVGGNSMVGQCIARGEARIALDVGQESVRFSNPLLPATHSEMALPLISRAKTIGALTVQSSRKAAFSQEDIAIFQTMAGQLANAIENARLFEQTQDELEETSTMLRRYIRDGWTRYLGKDK